MSDIDIEENLSEVIERFRKALQKEHHQDWTMEIISEAAHICAKSIVTSNYPNRPLAGDTPELAWKRYRNGGFGKRDTKPALAALHKYLELFDREQTL
jgi:hypothetical protein